MKCFQSARGGWHSRVSGNPAVFAAPQVIPASAGMTRHVVATPGWYSRASGNPLRRMPGFTLLEMLVVLLIIGLLVGLVGPRLFGRVETSKIQAAEA
ncbi:MAG: prepilin-type N-terminal cleavage/methylation domain-containing protein, partial [Betaproteobacteria bacterium]